MSIFRSPPQPGQSGSEEQDSQQQGTEFPQQPQYPPQFPQQPQYPPQQQQWQQPPRQPFPPQKPPKKHRVRRVLGIGCSSVIALIVLIVIIVVATSHGGTTTNSNTNSNTNANTQSTATVQPTTAPTRAITPAPSFASFGDGTYQVGKDIQPGTYRTRVGSSSCYYERLSGFGGTVGEIIANNITGDPAIVTIAATDKGFQSQNCGTWTKDLSQITTSKTTFSNGMYIVGTDIAPGTYRNSGQSGCYYATLSGFGNTTDDIIANNIINTPTIVSIAASVKGFQSNNCGTWTRE